MIGRAIVAGRPAAARVIVLSFQPESVVAVKFELVGLLMEAFALTVEPFGLPRRLFLLLRSLLLLPQSLLGRLFELCATEEEVAFVVAHEIAHHDLNHLALFHGWASAVASLPGAMLFALFLHALESRLYGPEKECDADRHAMDLCLASGYSGDLCLKLMDVLERRALYVGDEECVYGPDEESDDELDENASWKTKAQIWAWQRKRGYLPIRDRRQMLRKHLDKANGAAK